MLFRSVSQSRYGGRDGCSGYRVKNHLTEIAKYHKEHDVKFIEGGDSGEHILKLITGADVVLMREQHDSFLRFLKSQDEIDISRKLFVVDMDDDVFDISPFNEAYRTAGVSEVKYQDKWLWKNGENGFDAERNRKAADMRVDFLKNADLITVTTPILQKRIQSISQNNGSGNCMLVYVKHLKKYGTDGVVYQIPTFGNPRDPGYHIEAATGRNVSDSTYKKFEIGTVKRCDFSKVKMGAPARFINEVYCETALGVIDFLPEQFNEYGE